MYSLISKVCKWLYRWEMPLNSEDALQLLKLLKNSTAEMCCSPEAGARICYKLNGISAVFIFTKSTIWKDSQWYIVSVLFIKFCKSVSKVGSHLTGTDDVRLNEEVIRNNDDIGASRVSKIHSRPQLPFPRGVLSQGRMAFRRKVPHYCWPGLGPQTQYRESSGRQICAHGFSSTSWFFVASYKKGHRWVKPAHWVIKPLHFINM